MLYNITNLYYTISIKWVFGPLPPRASIKWVLCGKIRAGSPFYRGGLPRIWESIEALEIFDDVGCFFLRGFLGLGWLRDVWGIFRILKISMEFYGYLGLCEKAPSLTSNFLAFPSQDLPGTNIFSIFLHFIEASPCNTVLFPIL